MTNLLSPRGFSLPVATTADLSPLFVLGMGGAPRLREGKITPDGRLTYSTGCMLMIERNGEISPQRSASVHVVEPAATYELAAQYMAAGLVWVMPYEANGRVALSIICERLVPVTDASLDELLGADDE